MHKNTVTNLLQLCKMADPSVRYGKKDSNTRMWQGPKVTQKEGE